MIETGKPLAERRRLGQKLRPPVWKPLDVTFQAGDDLAPQAPVVAPSQAGLFVRRCRFAVFGGRDGDDLNTVRAANPQDDGGGVHGAGRGVRDGDDVPSVGALGSEPLDAVGGVERDNGAGGPPLAYQSGPVDAVCLFCGLEGS